MKKAFTLIELLVTITIISLLTAASVVSYVSANKKARDNRRKSDLEQIRSALEMYYSDEDQYPAEADFTFGESLSGSSGTYMQEIPQDPKSPTYSYFYELLAGGGYCLCANLEADSSTTVDADCSCSAVGSCGTDTACNYSVKNP